MKRLLICLVMVTVFILSGCEAEKDPTQEMQTESLMSTPSDSKEESSQAISYKETETLREELDENVSIDLTYPVFISSDYAHMEGNIVSFDEEKLRDIFGEGEYTVDLGTFRYFSPNGRYYREMIIPDELSAQPLPEYEEELEQFSRQEAEKRIKEAFSSLNLGVEIFHTFICV